MINETWSNENISLKNLSLWDENARFPDKYFNKTEKELISYFCQQKNFKILDLAKSIVNEFDLPQIEKIVVYNVDGRNVVLEGNRRLTVYKLLVNPKLIDDPSLAKKFNELRLKLNINEDFELECLVTEDLNEGYRYIERKHLNGNNESGWGDTEKTHHKNRRGKANQIELFKLGIIKRIRILNIPESMKDQILGFGYVSTLWRILSSSPAWKRYGFDMNKDGSLRIKNKSFEEELKVIIVNILKRKDFLGKTIDSRSLNKNEDKEDYLKSITKSNYKKAEIEIDKQKEILLDQGNSEEIIKTTENVKIKINPKSTMRPYLIPKNFRLKINEVKINNIFRELRDDLLINDSNKSVPNAVGVLFRVFLEISLDCYAKKNQYGFKNKDTISKKIPWVVNDLISKGYEESKFSYINKVGSAKKENTYLSIDNFHEYVHSTTTQPTSSDLKAKWDHLQEFFEILWEEISKKGKKERK